jgi:hypothetical protein
MRPEEATMLGMILAIVLSGPCDSYADHIPILEGNVENARRWNPQDVPSHEEQLRAGRARLRACEEAVKAGEQRKREEELQLEKAEADRAARERDVEQRRKDVSVMRTAHSARLCVLEQDRKKALDEIAKETKYAKLAGVVNLSALQELKARVRGDDEKMAAARKFFGQVKPVPCKDPTVAEVARCIEGRLESCSEKALQVAEVLLPEELRIGAE